MSIEVANYFDGYSKIMFLGLSLSGFVMFCIFTRWSLQNNGVVSKLTLVLTVATAAWLAAGLWKCFS